MKKFLIFLVAVAMLFSALPALAGDSLAPDPNRLSDFGAAYMGERILWDVIVVRPVSTAAIGLGLVGTVVAAPFAAMTCTEDLVARELIQKPVEFTFTRPVGDIDF